MVNVSCNCEDLESTCLPYSLSMQGLWRGCRTALGVQGGVSGGRTRAESISPASCSRLTLTTLVPGNVKGPIPQSSATEICSVFQITLWMDDVSHDFFGDVED